MTLLAWPNCEATEWFVRRKKTNSAEDTAGVTGEAGQAEESADAEESATRRTALPPAPRPDGPWDAS
ncbi:hypothetical protein CLM82_27715, partial [Streptomyces albidoflavus]